MAAQKLNDSTVYIQLLAANFKVNKLSILSIYLSCTAVADESEE